MSENFANNWGVVSQKIILYCFDQVEKKSHQEKLNEINLLFLMRLWATVILKIYWKKTFMTTS